MRQYLRVKQDKFLMTKPISNQFEIYINNSTILIVKINETLSILFNNLLLVNKN